MRRVTFLSFVKFSFAAVFGLAVSFGHAESEHPEVTRTKGFSEYKRQKNLMDKEKEKGLELHLEKLEMEKREYQKALEEYRAQKKKGSPLEYTPAYPQHLALRDEAKRKAAEALSEIRREKAEERRLLQQVRINKMEELGLPEDRPRFDVDKRSLYGASPKYGKGTPGSGGAGFGGSSGSSFPDFGSGSGGFYQPPPPPTFDEFPPPQSFPGDDGFDLPAPPPPPPMDFDNSNGMGQPAFDDFPPPPPPPPPPVEDFSF